MKTNQKKAIEGQAHQQEASQTVGDALRSYRLKARLTQQAAASHAGISRQTVSRIESGDPSVSVGQLIRFADAIKALALFQFVGAGDAPAGTRRVRHSKKELMLAASAPVGMAPTCTQMMALA